jgi:hypothetical protein
LKNWARIRVEEIEVIVHRHRGGGERERERDGYLTDFFRVNLVNNWEHNGCPWVPNYYPSNLSPNG